MLLTMDWQYLDDEHWRKILERYFVDGDTTKPRTVVICGTPYKAYVASYDAVTDSYRDSSTGILHNFIIRKSIKLVFREVIKEVTE